MGETPRKFGIYRFLPLLVLFLPQCGYSQEEWDQKTRENESLRNQALAKQLAHKKCEADYADALHSVDDLNRQLKERGFDLDNLATSLEQHRKAVSEYKRRVEQLKEVEGRRGLLNERLAGLQDQGVSVVVRQNRLLIQLPADLLFEGATDRLKKGGEELLRKVALIFTETAFAQRRFQVQGHSDSRTVHGPFKDRWGLSAMRARSVVSFFILSAEKGGGGLTPSRLSAAGFADSQPVDPGKGTEADKRNRRIEIVALPSADEMLNLGSISTR